MTILPTAEATYDPGSATLHKSVTVNGEVVRVVLHVRPDLWGGRELLGIRNHLAELERRELAHACRKRWGPGRLAKVADGEYRWEAL